MLNSGRKSHCFWYCFQNTLNFIIVHLDCCCSVTKLYLSNDQFFISGGQSIGASALASVLPMNIQG